jgi:hypothetical protein
VIATFGRGFYVLDDITPLRRAKAELLQQSATLFPVKDPLLYIERLPLGLPKKGFEGDAFFTAENPPFGATFTYYLKEKLRTKKEQRQESEKEAAKKNETLPYPTNDQMRAEGDAPAPEVYFIVYDDSGAPIRRVAGNVGEGFHRTNWDLRYFAPSLPDGGGSEEDEDFPSAGTLGPLVLPGKYSVRLFKKVDGAISEIGTAHSFNVVADGTSGLSAADRSAQQDFNRRVSRLYRAVSGAINSANEVQERIKSMRKALQDTPNSDSLLAQADSIERQNRDILRALRGDEVLAARSENVPTSINDRLQGIMEGERFSIAKPTQTHVDAYNIASDEFSQQLSKLRTLIQVDVANLEKAMEAAGAPWTPGRIPDWQEK